MRFKKLELSNMLFPPYHSYLLFRKQQQPTQTAAFKDKGTERCCICCPDVSEIHSLLNLSPQN